MRMLTVYSRATQKTAGKGYYPPEKVLYLLNVVMLRIFKLRIVSMCLDLMFQLDQKTQST